MMSIFEKQLGAGAVGGPQFSAKLSRPVSIILIAVVVVVALYITFFLLPAFSDDALNGVGAGAAKRRAPDNIHLPVSYKPRKVRDPDLKPDENDGERPPPSTPNDRASTRQMLAGAWGYNRDRNLPRWKAIRESIERDLSSRNDNHRGGEPFVLVDYGSDAGYFSVSAAFAFKKHNIFVLSVEMGGVGGEIWLKPGDKQDVLSTQEQQADKFGVAQNMMICQTKLHQDMFFALERARQVHRYQLVLSVFHWFDMPTRKDFEAALVALFRNARTTFIELPTIGDRGKLIRKQVGWERFEKWYDNRTDIKQIIEDAGTLQNFPVRATKIVGVKWLKWTRDVYRVDVDEHYLRSNNLKAADMRFNCDLRREVYKCKKRQRLQKCHDVVVVSDHSLIAA